MKLAYNLFRLLRPRQWIKNFAIFAAVIFSGHLLILESLIQSILAFLIFCAISSTIYIINDLFDIQKDRMHPFKKFRPLAHNDVPIPLAVITAFILATFSLITGFFLTSGFFLILLIYLALQISYSVVLKHIAVIDILALAAGYMLRVYAGEFATGFHISVWLLMTTISGSLFVAIGKRRSELTLVSKYSQAQIAAMRRSLSHYSERLLDVYASIFATSTFISYSLFTFLQNPSNQSTLDILLPEFWPDYLQRKWLMITILPVVYGLMRYLQDIYEKHEGESPEKVLLSDIPLITTVMIWISLVIFIIYIIPT